MRAPRRRRQLSSSWPRWTRRAARRGRRPCAPLPWRWASGRWALARTHPYLACLFIYFHNTQCDRHITKPLKIAPAGGPGMVSRRGGACCRLLTRAQPAVYMIVSWIYSVTAEYSASYQGAHPACSAPPVYSTPACACARAWRLPQRPGTRCTLSRIPRRAPLRLRALRLVSPRA